jgi:predicted nucleotidyltransferase component of viral defense system
VTPRKVADLSASVHQRLLNLSKQRGEDFQFTLDRYAAERLLYRLSQSQHRERFVLKGAVLYSVWSPQTYRATRDVDLLGWGDPSAAGLRGIFREICQVQVEDDGLTFPADSVTVEEIREDQVYGGVRVKLTGLLGRARANVQVDVGFGDTITPAPVEVECSSLLGFPPPVLRAYPRESVVSEKFEASVALGMANSRMKDFHDLHYLSQEFEFEGARLRSAIVATFGRRRTALPTETPVALSERFYQDRDKMTQWSAFLRRTPGLAVDLTLEAVCLALQGFLMPPVEAAATGDAFDLVWSPRGPWKSREEG